MTVFLLIVLGLAFGSFFNAFVWRLHEQSKRQSKKSAKELSIISGRSMCPNCRHKLSSGDLVPVFSWLYLRGRCRYCKKPISWHYPFIELLTPILFVGSLYFWPLGFSGRGTFEFILWLIFLGGFIILGLYDFKWFILPDRIVLPFTVLALFQVLILATTFHQGSGVIFGAFWGVITIAGLFYLLFQVSKGRWIGGGDVKLGVLIGLLVGGPGDAFLVLFFSSLAGTIYALPQLLTKKAKTTNQVPFGPFLLLATIIVKLFAASIISWYKRQYL